MIASQGCGNVAEVALVIDVSQSIDDTELGQMISFVKGLVTALEPSPEGIRIAAVKYNTLGQVVFELDAHTTASEVNSALDAIETEGTAGLTNTQNALEIVRDNVFADNRVREGVVKVIVLVSDGVQSVGSIANVVPEMKGAGIQFVTVGVNTEGDDLPGELAYIASNPTWVFNVDGFADLAPIIEDVSTVTCEQAIGPAVPLGNGLLWAHYTYGLQFSDTTATPSAESSVEGEWSCHIFPTTSGGMEASGSVFSWSFHATATGKILLQVWRGTDTVGQYQLVGSVEYIIDTVGDLTIQTSSLSTSTLSVEAGDFLGYAFTGESPIPYFDEAGCEDVFGFSQSGDSFTSGQTYTFSLLGDTPCRKYALEVLVVTVSFSWIQYVGYGVEGDATATLANVETIEKCQQICLEEERFVCASLTYNVRGSQDCNLFDSVKSDDWSQALTSFDYWELHILPGACMGQSVAWQYVSDTTFVAEGETQHSLATESTSSVACEFYCAQDDTCLAVTREGTTCTTSTTASETALTTDGGGQEYLEWSCIPNLPCAPQMDLVPIDAPAGFNGLLVFVSRPFRCSGRLTSIKFRAVAEGDFVLSIWRKVIDSSLTISMVHKVQIGFHSQEGSDPLIIPGEGYINFPDSFNMLVGEGDFFGIHYLTSESTAMILTTVGPHDGLLETDYSLVYSEELYDADISPGFELSEINAIARYYTAISFTMETSAIVPGVDLEPVLFPMDVCYTTTTALSSYSSDAIIGAGTNLAIGEGPTGSPFGAMVLDGVSSNVMFGPNIRLSFNQAFTFFLHVYAEQDTEGTQDTERTIFHYPMQDGYSVQLRLDSVQERFIFAIYEPPPFAGDNQVELLSGYLPATGQLYGHWHALTGVYDYAARSVSLNGDISGSAATSFSADTSGALNIGSTIDSQVFFKGRVSCLRFYPEVRIEDTFLTDLSCNVAVCKLFVCF